MNTVIVGLQYGDEGKGRVSGYFVKDYDWSIRFNGGPNAGHTVWNSGKEYKLNHLPAGAVHGKKVALDSGMVINLKSLKQECEKVGGDIYNRLYVSRNVNIIQESHLEEDKNGSGIGSTKRGIAYVYRDRALRKGKRIEDIEHKEKFFTQYKGLPPMAKGEKALLESAQAIMLDVDYGEYPYVTSSNVMPSIVHNITKRIGVMKAYISRVGDGPPYSDDIPEIREVGKEYGTTTGRPRKCTWINLRDLDYAISVTQPDEIVVTKLDVLDGLKEIRWFNENGDYRGCIGLNEYENFLLDRFPQIKWFSKSASGDLIKVR